MSLVSRDRGKEVLTELVASLDQLEKVATISDIFINPNFDSVLESRFIESLRRMGGTLGLPPVKLVQDIVNGKSGYVLELGAQRYRIEPQCNIGHSEGVAVASKPDFVIWPWQAGSNRKPIAVFCDGWTYHQHSLREDAAKRSALVASGNYWVWSVTHEDVKSALSSAAGTDLDSPLVVFNRHDGSAAPTGLPRAAQGAFANQAVFQLLSILATPSGTPDQLDAAVLQMQRNAVWLGFLLVSSTPADLAVVNSDSVAWLQQLPLAMQNPGKSHAPSLSRKDAFPLVLSWWPLACAGGVMKGVTSPGVLVLDDLADQTECPVSCDHMKLDTNVIFERENFQVRGVAAILTHIFAALSGFVHLQKMQLCDTFANAYQWKRELFCEVVASFIRSFVPGKDSLRPQFHSVVNA